MDNYKQSITKITSVFWYSLLLSYPLLIYGYVHFMEKRHFHSVVNWIQILLLAVAIASLGYSTWRAKVSEHNATTRSASFEALQALGALQLVIDYAHFNEDLDKGDSIKGWQHILLIQDMSAFLDSSQQEQAKKLHASWEKHWPDIQSSRSVTDQITQVIQETRENLIGGLKNIH